MNPDARKCKRMKTALTEETGKIQAMTERYLAESGNYLLRRIPEKTYDNGAGESPRKVRFSTAPMVDTGYANILVEGNTAGQMTGRNEADVSEAFDTTVDRNGSFGCNIPGQQIQIGYDVFGRSLQAKAYETGEVCMMDLISKEYVNDYFRMLRTDLPKRGMEQFTYDLERKVIALSHYNTAITGSLNFARGYFPARPKGQLDLGTIKRLFTILKSHGWTGTPEVEVSPQAFETMRLNYKKGMGLELQATLVSPETHFLTADTTVLSWGGINWIINDTPLRVRLVKNPNNSGFTAVPVRPLKTRPGTGEGIVAEPNEDYYLGRTWIDGKYEELYEVGFYVHPTAATRMPFAMPQLTDKSFDKSMFNMSVKLIDGAYLKCNEDNLRFKYRMLHAYGFESLNPELMGAILYQIAPEGIIVNARPEECDPGTLDVVGFAPPHPMIHDGCSATRCDDCEDIVETPIDPRPDNSLQDDCQVTGAGKLRFYSAGPFVTKPNAGSVVIAVERFNGYDGAASVNFATAPGTAIAGTDYTTTTGTLNWADQDGARKYITIPILPGGTGNKSFDLTLSTFVGAATPGVDGITTVTVEIVEPDICEADPESPDATAGAIAQAAANGVDLRNVAGNGPGGRITKTDVDDFIATLIPGASNVTSVTYTKGGTPTTIDLSTPARNLDDAAERDALKVTLEAHADVTFALFEQLATGKWRLSLRFITGAVFAAAKLNISATPYNVVILP